jgi:hypothetical protein
VTPTLDHEREPHEQAQRAADEAGPDSVAPSAHRLPSLSLMIGIT